MSRTETTTVTTTKEFDAKGRVVKETVTTVTHVSDTPQYHYYWTNPQPYTYPIYPTISGTSGSTGTLRLYNATSSLS